jgi:Gluconate 2-dehydrogenase subunit 3
MPIKRRGFVRGLLLAPAAPLVLTAQQTAPTTQPAPQPNPPAVQVPRQPQAAPKLPMTEVDVTAETERRFFSADQFAVLEKLGSVLMPPMKGNPGALDAHAPEFMDFLISVSPTDRQKLYRNGLDHLNAQAKQKFNRGFAELDATQADAILKPLLAVRLWPQDMPSDPIKNFIMQVHDDLRTATRNSREWAAAGGAPGRRFTRGFGGSGLYLAPVDPIVGEE